MYSKRQLYKPAPKQNVGQKKVVRKLVQGKLEDSTTEVTNFAGPVTSLGPDPNRSVDTSLQKSDLATHYDMSAMSMRASSVTSDAYDELLMSPCRSVPVMTEYASPRVDPDLNLSLASSTSTTRQQPIMVCDASHLGSSPDNTEVEVVVDYEDSPARVICHTPGRQSGMNNSSPHHSARRRGPLSLVFESPKAGGTSGGNENYSVHGKEDDDIERKMAVQRKENRDVFLSEHSRGIIKEILAEEIGSRDISSLSLYSQESITNLPQSSSPAEILKQSTSESVESSRHVELNKTPEKRDFPKPLSSKLNFDEESDASCSENNVARKDRINRTPKIEAAKTQLIKQQNDSDSETCSLYEYVTQKKTNPSSEKKKQIDQKVQQNKSQPDFGKRPGSNKKKPGRIVASRFMQSSSDRNNMSSLSSHKDSAERSNSRNINVSNTTKPKIMSTKSSVNSKPVSKVNITNNNSLLPSTKNMPRSISSTTTITRHTKDQGKKDRDRLTSTPTHDETYNNRYEIDASSILPSMSLMAANDYNSSDIDNAGITGATVKQNLATAVNVKQSSSSSSKQTDKISPLQLDLQYTRYLQALYLSTQAKKSFKGQEKQAMDQLNGLWKLHEKKRAELAASKMELERLKTLLEIDNTLDATESQLASLEEKAPQVVKDYANLVSAVNNTRHQISTKDIYIPNKTEEEREAYEDKMESTLSESERLLGKIASLTGHTFPPLHQYTASLEAISGNVDESGTELREGYKDLEMAHGLCSQLSSHMVMPML